MAYKRTLPLLFLRLGFPYSSLNPIGYKRKRRRNKKRNSKGNKKHESKKPKLPIHYLPLDIVVEVLSNLPVKTLQRFRCVCKSWDSLIQQDHYLVSRHCSNSKQSLVSLSFTRDWIYDRVLDSFSALHDYTLDFSTGDDPAIRSFSFSQLRRDKTYAMTNSCNGLVGIYGVDSFYVANPSIRKMRVLPGSCSSHHTFRSRIPVAGLGFDASIGVYKLVRVFDREFDKYNPGPVSMGCEVLYLGGNKTRSWKLIDDPPGQPSRMFLPVVVNGVIYWKLEAGLSVALSLDLSQEKFGFVTHPEGDSRLLWPRLSRVSELGGCLCVADFLPYPSRRRMNIWLLKDYRNSKWVKQYVIDLTKVYKPIHHFDVQVQPLTLDNGRIIFSYGQGRRDYYDVKTRRFGKHVQIPHIVEVDVYPYTESMVWPWSRFCRVK